VRLVSLCPSNTEILFALGLGSQVVGVDDWSDWPADTAELPRVGPDLSVHLDRVAALRPDLVLASLSVPGMEKNVEGLERLGLPHIVLDPHSLSDVLSDIERVGEACGARDVAAAIVTGARRRIEGIRDRAAGRRRLRVYWEWWPKPMIAAGRGSWVHEMSDVAGCENVFADIDKPSAPVDPGEVARRDPELLMICWCGTLQRLQEPGRVASRQGWDRIDGVRHGRIHCVPESLFGRPSQRLMEGLDLLERLADAGGSS
jgi:iron complex transport system substrate-binding protein